MKRLVRASVGNSIGHIRGNNEDNYFLNGSFMALEEMDQGCNETAASSDSRQLYAVCDGMGGVEAGELASFTAARGLTKLHSAFKERGARNVHKTISDAVRNINNDLCALCGGKGAASTLVLLAINKMRASVAWLGDSRAYLYREGELMLLTQDHTQAQRLIKLGVMEADSDEVQKKSNVLTWYIGMKLDGLELTPDWSKTIKLKRGDAFLLCSDGLTDMLTSGEIASALRGRLPEDAVKELVDLALKNGGKDNITAMVIDIAV